MGSAIGFQGGLHGGVFYADRIIDHGPRAVIVSWFVGKLDVVGFKL